MNKKYGDLTKEEKTVVDKARKQGRLEYYAPRTDEWFLTNRYEENVFHGHITELFKITVLQLLIPTLFLQSTVKNLNLFRLNLL